ncbi:MAG: hypothetical protein AAGB11_00175 [Pseudomonadota bacterium]
MTGLAGAIDRILSPKVGAGVLIVLGVVLILFPLVGESARYFAVLLMTVFLFATLGHAWNLLAGFCGLLSFGTQVYVGLSGFTVAIAVYYFGVPVWVGAILGAIVAALFAWLQAMPASDRNMRRNTTVGVIIAVILWAIYEIIIAVNPAADVFGSDYIRRVILLFCIFLGALPLLKLQGAYFAVATWLIAAAVASIFNEWQVVGAGGGMTIPSDTSIAERYYGGLIILAASTLVVWWLLNSRYGAALTAVRDDEEAATAIGIDIRRIKTMVFVISAPMAGLAAAVYYIDTVTITPPDAFSIRWSAYVVFIVVAGGMGTLWGPVVGAVLFVIVQRFLVGFWGGGELTLGIAAVLLILVLPRGAVGLVEDLKLWAGRRRNGNAPVHPMKQQAVAREALGQLTGNLAHSTGADRGTRASSPGAGVVAAALVPGSPLPALRPENPPWQDLAHAAGTLGERFKQARVDTVVAFLEPWRGAAGNEIFAGNTLRVRYGDPSVGAIACRADVDVSLADAVLRTATAHRVPVVGINALNQPVEGAVVAANTLIDPRGAFRFVFCGAGIGGRDADLGAIFAQEAAALGRRIAIVGAGSLSGAIPPMTVSPEEDAITSAADDARNRQLLGGLMAADGRAITVTAGTAGTNLSHVAFVVGALGDRWSGADVLAYGATGGVGSAVVAFHIT